MANISLTIKSDFAQAERDFRTLMGTSEEARAKIEKFQQSFKTEKIDQFIAKNRLNAVAIKATQGPTAALAAETAGLQRKIQQLIASGLSPEDASLKKLINSYKQLSAQQSKSQATSASGASLMARYAIAMGTFYTAMQGGRMVWSSFIEPAMRAQEAASKFQTIFGSSSSSVTAWADQLAVSIGRSSRELQGMAADMMAVISPMAGSRDAAIRMSEGFVQMAQDLASFHNVDVSEAFAALRSGITGETEPLKRFGIILTDAALQEYALAQGIRKKVSEMSTAEKTQLRYNAILAGMGAATGDAERTSGSLTNKIRALEAATSDQAVALGTRMIPGMTVLVSAMTDTMRAGGGLTTTLNNVADGMNTILTFTGNLINLFNRNSQATEQSNNAFLKLYQYSLLPIRAAFEPLIAIWNTATGLMGRLNTAMAQSPADQLAEKQRQMSTVAQGLIQRHGSLEAALRSTGDTGVAQYRRLADEAKALERETAPPHRRVVNQLEDVARAFQRAAGGDQAAQQQRRDAAARNAEERIRLEQDWIKKITESLSQEEELREYALEIRLGQNEREYEQALAQAARVQADRTNIDAYYTAQRIKIQQEESQKRTQDMIKYSQTMTSNLHSAFSDLLTTMQNFGHQAKALVITVKVLAMAEAAINSYLAFTQVLADKTIWPTWARIPIAATILAAGLAKQAAIASTPISAETGITQYTVPEIRANRNDKAPVMASAGEQVTVTPRGESTESTTSVNIQIGEDTLFRVVQRGINTGKININQRNLGRSVFA